ncbi:MAG TPA: hypothetical protein VKZ53_06780 [Candidatus Angelobacter sp.]|nr:hypothetical protein [Candidatus Angelobacter sp.]
MSGSFMQIIYISPREEINVENDNIDVHVKLDDGRVFSLLVATPNNIYWCMDNIGVNYFFGTPPLFVRLLTEEQIETAIRALLTEDDGYWLSVYGALQDPICPES